MPTIYAASESTVSLDGKPIEGVRALEFRQARQRTNVYALGSTERIAVISGPESVEGRLVVASTSPALDAVGAGMFQLMATLRHGETSRTVTFDECYLTGRSFAMSAGEHGEGTYMFSAARVRDDPPAAAPA
ncbi:hypothetical protein J8J14_13790 [Roseomonas sp. SSH11]|uniref:Uncharacterized protein n=1 Tax=Pararoseomonas baculiformis TaxID=2820812 RepID=A0ABS4AFN5_9PROT|nr:hypothetical protein [Pararoseomonas baculiformis]MBP0445847.1 hypothetical protein [Pararoseomonas baculiformis]